uniref:Isoflavone reductase-IRL-like-like protein n=1 Tax=Aegilops tauschii TaxID=37682 RepID=N1QP26_AEGTA
MAIYITRNASLLGIRFKPSFTLNKILYMRPPANIVSHNELISMWESKAGRTFQIVRILEADLLKLIKEAAFPLNILLSIALTIFVGGDQANFEIEPSFGGETTELYPDLKYTTVDEYLVRLL